MMRLYAITSKIMMAMMPDGMPFTLEWSAPGMVKMTMTMQGMTMIQAWDGETAWQVMPMMGQTEPQEAGEAEREQFQEMADLFPFLDYKDKGHTIEYIGEEDVEGTPAHKLKLTRENGNISYVFLDDEYFMQIRSEGTREMRGQEVRSSSSMGDYKEVEGLLFAHSTEITSQTPAGEQTMSLELEAIELGVEFEEGHFKMPASEGEEE